MKLKDRPYASQVLDIREAKFDTSTDVRIHRPHRWGNPFKIGKDGTRREVLKKFRAWFQKQPELMRDVEKLHGKRLRCKCRSGPTRPCHGEILLEFAAKPRRQREVLRPISLFPGVPVEPEEECGIKRRVETTNVPSAERVYRKPWVFLRESRDIAPDKTWVFTDGSTSGWHAAVIVQPGESMRALCKFIEPTRTRNVGAEINGFLLGVKNVEEDSTVVVVVDFLNIAAWSTGAFEMKDPEVKAKITKAKEIIAEKRLKLSFIHHSGHQEDTSDFTYFNDRADRLCSARVDTDVSSPWDEIENDL